MCQTKLSGLKLLALLPLWLCAACCLTCSAETIIYSAKAPIPAGDDLSGKAVIWNEPTLVQGKKIQALIPEEALNDADYAAGKILIHFRVDQAWTMNGRGAQAVKLIDSEREYITTTHPQWDNYGAIGGKVDFKLEFPLPEKPNPDDPLELVIPSGIIQWGKESPTRLEIWIDPAESAAVGPVLVPGKRLEIPVPADAFSDAEYAAGKAIIHFQSDAAWTMGGKGENTVKLVNSDGEFATTTHPQWDNYGAIGGNVDFKLEFPLPKKRSPDKPLTLIIPTGIIQWGAEPPTRFEIWSGFKLQARSFVDRMNRNCIIILGDSDGEIDTYRYEFPDRTVVTTAATQNDFNLVNVGNHKITGLGDIIASGNFSQAFDGERSQFLEFTQNILRRIYST